MAISDLSGTTLKGYALAERIGAGGLGAVYKAHQTTVAREVAIKIIIPHFANHPEFIRRFENEAQLVARLEHPHIVPLYDYWRDPDGAYLVMRWLRGGSLADALKNGPFALPLAVEVIDQLAGGLSVAHRTQIIHRDLKPANILLDEDSNAYLADFGIAKDVGIQGSGITEVDAIVGSPDYLAPEQARGEQVTPHTDIYSLGVVLYEMLAGQHPFPGLNSIERLFRHLNEPLPSLTNLPNEVRDAINAVIQRATAKDPAHRYLDVLEMAAAFRAAALTTASDNLVERLTVREQEILGRIIEGKSNKQIAQELFITLMTVKWYVTQIYRKLGVRSRVQAIVRARELDLITGGRTSTGLSVVDGVRIPTEDFFPENPYKGLRAFQSADHQDFFGREKLVSKLVKRLEENVMSTSGSITREGSGARFLGVVGPSGSGKSSVVKAGLIPAVWRGDLPNSEKWFVVEMMPGSRPLDELEVALTRVAANQAGGLREHLGRDQHGLTRVAGLILPDDGSQLLVVIDQFEEVFTLVEDESARRHFLNLIHAAVTDPRGRVRVVVTLRADYYDRPLLYPDFGELLRSHLETVLPLSADELERAIVKPVEQVGVMFEPGLVAQIVSEVHYQPGALPLLQYALTELFEGRTGHQLTLETYQSIGRTVGALAKRADEIFLGLGSVRIDRDASLNQYQETARQMFLRLVTLGEGAEDTRRRVARAELLAIADDSEVMDEVIDTFANYRLLALDNDPATRTPTVEVAHEALLREWERLRTWLNESREDIRIQRQLAAMASEWYGAGHDTSFLARGSRLEQFEGWVTITQLALTAQERTYLEKSIVQRDHEAQTEVERQVREKSLEQRSVRFLRALVGVFALAAVIALGLTFFAFKERERAEAALVISAENYQLSEARRLAGASTLLMPNVTQNAELAALLALRALKTTYSAEADAALTQASSLLFTEKIIPLVDDVLFETAALSPDESLIATGDLAGNVRLWDAQTFQPLASLPTQNGIIEEVIFSPDGTQLLTLISDASGDDIGYVRLWDLASNTLIREQLMDKSGFPDHAAFTPDGQSLIIATYSFFRDVLIIYVWDAVTWETLLTIDDAANINVDQNVGGADAMSLSITGTQFAYINVEGQIVLRSWETGEIEAVISDVSTSTYSNALVYSSDGSRLAVSNPDGVFVIDVATHAVQMSIQNPPGESVARLAFTPDGQALLLTATSNLYLFDAVTGDPLRRFSGGSRHISPDFFRDGKRFIAVSDDGLRLWNADLNYLSTAISVEGFIPTPSDDASILASANQEIVVYDAKTGAILKTLPNDTGAFWTTLSPDNRYLFVGTGVDPGILTLWEWQTAKVIWQVELPYGISESDFSPDGRYIISSHNDGIARLWNAADGTLVREFHGDYKLDFVAIFSQDGSKIIAGGTGLVAQIWDVATGEALHTFQVANDPDGWLMAAEMSPDSRLLTTLGRDSGVQLWDIATGKRLFDATTYGSRSRFSHNGRYLAYTAENNHILLLDVETMQVARRIFSSHPSGRRTWFSLDDRYLYMGNTDQTYSRYEVELGNVMADVCSRLIRDFSPEERERYYISDNLPTCPK